MHILFSIFAVFAISLPVGNLDRIRRAIEKMEYEKAYELIERARLKAPSDPGVDYFASLLYFTKPYDSYNLDSARKYVNNSIEKFSLIDEEASLDLKDDGITISVVEELGDDIRDRMYRQLQNNLNVVDIENFMAIYSRSPYEEELVFKRDSIVFLDVRNDDKIESYEGFLANYTTESYREISIVRLDELRFDELSKSANLESYYSFHRAYPTSKFLNQVEEFVFENSTKGHSPVAYRDFISFAREKKWKERAANLLFYLSGDPSILNRDSVLEVRNNQNVRLIPAMENGSFGFHNVDGLVHISYEFQDVSSDYKCTPTSSDWLLVETQSGGEIISKAGKKVLKNVDGFEDLGFGAVLVEKKDLKFVYHKSGLKILEEPVESAAVIGEKWIKVERNSRSSLVSFAGKYLTDFEFNDIYLLGDFWVFEKDGLIAVSNYDTVSKGLVGGGLALEFKFDDLELVEDAVLIGFRGDRECMLDSSLEFLIPWGEYEINPDASNWYLRNESGYRIYDQSLGDIRDEVHPYLETNYGWLALKTNEDWMLLPRSQKVSPSRGYDSLKLVNDYFTYAVKGDYQTLICSNGTVRQLNENELVRTFINKKDNILIEGEEELFVLDTAGNEMLSGNYDEVTFLNDTLIRTLGRKGYGLIHVNGETLLESEYDAINLDDQLALTLKRDRIGCLDLRTGVVVDPSSKARIEKINNLFTVKGEQGYGLVDSKKNTILSQNYQEILFWNDTSFLVESSNYWVIVTDGDVVVSDTLQSIRKIAEVEEETFWRFVFKGKYGIISNLNGVILEANYTDIVNIGIDQEPLFFADQHLDKAKFHVVSYIDPLGGLLFSKAYNKDDFERVLCDD